MNKNGFLQFTTTQFGKYACATTCTQSRANQAVTTMFAAESPAAKVLTGKTHFIAFQEAVNMPKHVTTFRGRGGLGKSKQSMFQHFFRFSTDQADPSWAIQTLVHTYVYQSSAITYLNANVDITWPNWIENWQDANAPDFQNTGDKVLNVAKIAILGAPS